MLVLGAGGARVGGGGVEGSGGAGAGEGGFGGVGAGVGGDAFSTHPGGWGRVWLRLSELGRRR